jgi:hypothetical protein
VLLVEWGGAEHTQEMRRSQGPIHSPPLVKVRHERGVTADFVHLSSSLTLALPSSACSLGYSEVTSRVPHKILNSHLWWYWRRSRRQPRRNKDDDDDAFDDDEGDGG